MAKSQPEHFFIRRSLCCLFTAGFITTSMTTTLISSLAFSQVGHPVLKKQKLQCPNFAGEYTCKNDEFPSVGLEKMNISQGNDFIVNDFSIPLLVGPQDNGDGMKSEVTCDLNNNSMNVWIQLTVPGAQNDLEQSSSAETSNPDPIEMGFLLTTTTKYTQFANGGLKIVNQDDNGNILFAKTCAKVGFALEANNRINLK